MADPPGQPDSKPHTRPRWVKVSLAIVLVLALLFVALQLAGGEHGPGRHLPGVGGGDAPPVEHGQ
ncbi:MAG: hypothetical protein HY658_03275 [Actinobacteria bacterium]|nr:hypothetical protein [Actinomycetota bacterium]